jgi:hypothetical protein
MMSLRNIFAAVGLVMASASPALAFLQSDTFSGLVVWIFCGYCGIIVVAQLLGALIALKRVVDNWADKRRQSKQVPLR